MCTQMSTGAALHRRPPGGRGGRSKLLQSGQAASCTWLAGSRAESDGKQVQALTTQESPVPCLSYVMLSSKMPWICFQGIEMGYPFISVASACRARLPTLAVTASSAGTMFRRPQLPAVAVRVSTMGSRVCPLAPVACLSSSARLPDEAHSVSAT